MTLMVVIANFFVHIKTKNHIYSNIDQLPVNDVGLVLGTARTVNGKFENLFFTYRINTAAELFHKGKVKHLLVSGDNSNAHYNEPLDMKKGLRNLGVPDSCITMDFGGRRTFDSVIRCNKVFGQKRFTIITQDFHTPRSVYIGRANDLEVVGFNSPTPKTDRSWTQQREWLARCKALLDLHLLGTEPRFLGNSIEIEVRP